MQTTEQKAQNEAKPMEAVTVTVNNVTRLEPAVLYVSFAKQYDALRLPEEVIDLEQMQKIISYCANTKSYLNSLSVYLDIATRAAKRRGKEARIEYDDMVCRKNIVSSYMDVIDNISKTASRMVTIYLEAKKAAEEDGYTRRAQPPVYHK